MGDGVRGRGWGGDGEDREDEADLVWGGVGRRCWQRMGGGRGVDMIMGWRG